jgi:PAS domain S-box-containing protein
MGKILTWLPTATSALAGAAVLMSGGHGALYELAVAAAGLSVAGAVVFAIDSARRARDLARLHRAVLSSEERYREMFTYDPTAAYICTPSGALITCNPSFASMFGFRSVDDALTLDLGSACKGPTNARLFLDEVQTHGRLLDREVEYEGPDGKPLHVMQSAVGVFDKGGRLKEICGYIIDTTQRRQLEAQLRQAQKMEAVGQLAGGIAHDFNNILTAIIGFSDFALAHLGPDTLAHADVEEIRKAGQRAVDLTRQLLAFSRRQVVQPVVLDVNHVLTDMDRLIRRLLGAHIEFVTLHSAMEARVKIDRGQLEQILTNLVVNASDAMPAGGRLIVESSVEDVRDLGQGRFEFAPGSYVVISVCDTGTGIDAETQSRIFEPFFTTKGAGKGTGLGLSTVYGIVKQANGFIEVSSKPGDTRFKVYLPATGAPLDAPEAAAPSRAEASRSHATVLVVEDDTAVRELITDILAAEGYTTLVAGSGAEAMGVLDQRGSPVDLILTDVIMPEMGGRELAEEVERSFPNSKILFISGYPTTMVAQQGVLKSGVSFLEKPFSTEALKTKVLAMLN